MALLAMCCYDTPENKRHPLTERCLSSLFATVDMRKHRLIVVNNNSQSETRYLLDRFQSVKRLTAIHLDENVGTARAINKAWQTRLPGEHALKIDSDIFFYDNNWVDKMEACVARDPAIGIIGLKRKDLIERVGHPDFHWRSELVQLPQTAGQQWFAVEKVQHCLGSACLFNSKLLDKIGYLAQWGKYGLDDSLAAYRAIATGFYSCFLCNVDIDHIDPGDTPYQKEKEALAAKYMQAFSDYRDGLFSGKIDPYCGPDVDLEKAK